MANNILIGIGGTGYKVLRDIRKRIWAEVPDLTKRNSLPVSFLYIDSDEDATPVKLAGNPDLRVNGQDTAITPNEYLGIKNVDLDAIFRNLSAYPRLRYVIGNGEHIRSCMGEVGKAAGQKRRAGRILFAQNAGEYLSKVKNMVSELNRNVKNSNDLNIYIFAGLAGGTGSGSIVDAVSILLSDPTMAAANIEVYAMIPEMLPPTGADAGRYHANGYAALSELSALNVGVFLPADVIHGAEHITLNHPGNNKQFSLTLYTNVNKNGVVVDSYKDLPQLVADMIYFRMFSPTTEETKELEKSFRCENRPDYLVEYKTNTRPGKPIERARTKACGSFGIKRVRYPDEKLIALASETIAREAIKMFLYLNFDADAGFIDEPSKEVKDYDEYLKRSNLKNWKLSAADLSLSKPILKSSDGKTTPSFEEYWESVSNDYDYNSAKEWGDPLTVLQQYFEERYVGKTPRDAFREEKGVEAYFNAKSSDQIVNDCADVIVSNIAENLFNQWEAGTYSAYDVRQISERILALLKEKVKNFDADAVALEDKIEEEDKNLASIEEDYNRTGFLSQLLNKRRADRFRDYSNALKAKYLAKTQLASQQIFQRRLLPKLVQLFSGLQNDVQDFFGRNIAYVEKYGTLIGENTPAGNPDLTLANVEVADLDRLMKFVGELITDREKMSGFSAELRKYIAEGANKSFAKAGKKMSNYGALEEVAVERLKNKILAYHNEMMKNKPVLGMSVLEQLYHMYGENDDKIGQFASDIVNNSEVYIKLKDQAVIDNMPNTENPTTTPAAGPNTFMLISMPNLKTDDENLKSFVEKLKIKLKQAYNTSDTRNFKIMESSMGNEITIISYMNIFPIRTIDYMPFLQQKYLQLIDSPNDNTNNVNKVLLHSEGDGSKLPPIFGEGSGPTGDALIKYLFLGAVFGIVKVGEDELGNRGWGSVVTDIFGSETFSFMSDKFTGILSSAAFTPEVSSDIVEKVDELSAQPLHVNKKAEMAQAVKDLMKNYVLPEAGSPNNDLYKRYAAQAMDALKALS